MQNENARTAMSDVLQRVKQALAEEGVELDQFNIGLRRDWQQHASQENRRGQPDRTGSAEREIESVGLGARVRAGRHSSVTGTMDFVA